MISRLKEIFDEAIGQAVGQDIDAATPCVQRAAAALLVEMSRADSAVSDRERAHIARALGSVFALPADEVDVLMSAGEDRADDATSLYEFTSVLNDQLDHAQKVAFVEQLWRIAYADGELEKHEAHLARKVANLLHLRHREYIGAKLRAEGG